MCGKISSAQITNIGTPQGSRLSPLLFICLLADMDLWTENSKLNNFADDTQSMIISDNIEKAIEITQKEANNIIDFFDSNNKGKEITIGGQKLKSTNSEKLLGLHVNSNFGWSTHVEKISIELKKRICLLKRIKNRIPKKYDYRGSNF